MLRLAPHARFLAGLAAGIQLSACVGSLQVVARPPWIEDRSLSLVAEQLRIEVSERHVDVDAQFSFRSARAPRDRVMTFPVASPGGRARGFRAAIERRGESPLVLPTWRSSPSALPVGDADDDYDIFVPVAATIRGATLRIRYRQSRTCRFAYVLRSGSYWRGPIHQLDVRVVDPERRVVRASVEGIGPQRRAGGALQWRFVNVEPHDGVVLLTCGGRPPL